MLRKAYMKGISLAKTIDPARSILRTKNITVCKNPHLSSTLTLMYNAPNLAMYPGCLRKCLNFVIKNVTPTGNIKRYKVINMQVA